jgi:tryptophanyl-tRNA synthetase
MSQKTKTKTILTGAQPNKGFHLGNYLGAFKNWAKIQYDPTYESFFFIANMHAITLPQSPQQLVEQSLDCAAQYIACGLDPKHSHIFVQSHVIGHTELAWILGCITPIGQLQRMTQFKDKSAKQEAVNAGLLFYPVLMAADILLYNTDLVPIGEDQKQHLELTRDLAIKFNATFQPIFNIPEPQILEVGARIMSLQNPTEKMSKSDSNEKATVFLFEPIDAIRKKILSAVTDSDNRVAFSPEKPGISNLLQIASSLSQKSIPTLESEFVGKGYGAFKSFVADLVIDSLRPLQATHQSLLKDKPALLSILQNGAQIAQQRADEMLKKIYDAVGFLRK